MLVVPLRRGKRLYVNFNTAPIGEAMPALRESLPSWERCVMMVIGWLLAVANANWAAHETHSLIFHLVYLATLSVPFVVAHKRADCTWVRLTIEPLPRWVNLYSLIHMIFGLGAAAIIWPVMDAVGALGNRALLH